MHRGEALAFLRSLPDESVDAVITDPPYSSGGATRGDRMSNTSMKYTHGGTMLERLDFAGDNRDGRSFGYWCALWLSECLRVAKPGSPIVVFTDWRQLPTVTDAIQAGGWIWRGVVPWDKGDAARPAMGRFRNACEYAIWGSAGGMPDRVEVGCLSGIVRCHVNQADKHHLTGKPTEVMRALVKICSPGGVILDPFAGSGTTGVAALLEGRRFIGCELVAGYHAVASERLAAEADLAPYVPGAEQVSLFGGDK